MTLHQRLIIRTVNVWNKFKEFFRKKEPINLVPSFTREYDFSKCDTCQRDYCIFELEQVEDEFNPWLDPMIIEKES